MHAVATESINLREPFRCDVAPERERVRVAPVGEFDLAAVPEVDAALRDVVGVGFRHVVLDLTRVTFMDSAALHLVLRAYEASEADGFRLELTSGPPAVQRLFALTGADGILRFRA